MKQQRAFYKSCKNKLSFESADSSKIIFFKEKLKFIVNLLRLRDLYTNPYELIYQYELNIFEKKFQKKNPRNESLRFGLTNPDLHVRQSVFVRIQDLRIRIFKDLFLLCIRFVRIRWIHECRLNLLKMGGFVVHNSKRIFSSQDSQSTIQNESGFVVYELI
jgi:hypothetical protein